MFFKMYSGFKQLKQTKSIISEGGMWERGLILKQWLPSILKDSIWLYK